MCKAPWTAAARRRHGMNNTYEEDQSCDSIRLALTQRKGKAASSRRSPRCFAHFRTQVFITRKAEGESWQKQLQPPSESKVAVF